MALWTKITVQLFVVCKMTLAERTFLLMQRLSSGWNNDLDPLSVYLGKFFRISISGANYSDSKCVTVKYDSSGGLIWDVVYSTSPGALDLGGFLAVDDSGCVCVGGYSAVATGWDYLAIRYRQDSGAGVDAPSAILPSGYTLDQNFHNPFNPRTTICYSIPAATHVSLNVYNLAGSEVATLVHGVQQAGSHSIVFDASSLSSGIYFYRLQTASFVDTRRLVVIK